MDNTLLFLVLSVTVEALVEYARTICEHENKRTLALQLGALVCGVALCCLAGLDIYAGLGVTFRLPVVGCVLTGVFASRGANYAYASDILSKLQKSIAK